MMNPSLTICPAMVTVMVTDTVTVELRPAPGNAAPDRIGANGDPGKGSSRRCPLSIQTVWIVRALVRSLVVGRNASRLAGRSRPMAPVWTLPECG